MAQQQCDPITSFPWREKFESYAVGVFNEPCWVNEPLVEGSPSFEISTEDQSHGNNNTKKLKLPNTTENGKMTKLVLPEISLPSSGTYEFGIDVYRWGASNNQEGVRVYASTNGAIEGATELGFLPRIPNQSGGQYVSAEADDGWYTYFFPLPQGTRFIILRGENDGDHSVFLFLDNFVVKQRVFVTENQIVNSNPGTGQMTWDQFAQHVNSGHHFTNSTITLMEDITLGIHAMAGTEDDPFTGTFDGNGHSINAGIQNNAIGAETTGEMPLNFKAEKDGTYTLSVDVESVEMTYLHLIDNMTGADIDLLSSLRSNGAMEYSFEAKTTDYASRFKLVFAQGESANEDNFAFMRNNHLLVLGIEGQATLQVIDLMGRILSSETINGNVSKAVNAPAGVYVLRLINGDEVKTQKIVIK